MEAANLTITDLDAPTTATGVGLARRNSMTGGYSAAAARRRSSTGGGSLSRSGSPAGDEEGKPAAVAVASGAEACVAGAAVAVDKVCLIWSKGGG